jgi:hypothetical protein
MSKDSSGALWTCQAMVNMWQDECGGPMVGRLGTALVSNAACLDKFF